ncbi:MAG: translocation/assembly module TamB domain-containing protein [Prosthecobacter sp.]|jgi:autotransporter translocation and assembly factor TamB|nr:translocation/assembly module TamB domain-containing protein [Prosthecobacter sp.]
MRWLAVVLGLLVLVAIVFQEPLLRLVTQRAGVHFARAAGIDLQWQVKGRVLGDLQIADVTAHGGVVEKASVGEVRVEYDAWRLVRTFNPDVVHRVVLKDVDVALDLRNSPPPVEKEPQPAPTKPPPLVWPDIIDIDNVSADLTLRDGSRVIVRGLALRVGEGMPGILRCAELRMDSAGIHVTDAEAQVRWGERELVISDLELPYAVKLIRLAVDLTKFSDDTVKLSLEAGKGDGTLRIDAAADRVFAGPLQVVADLHLHELGSDDLSGVPLPDDVVFESIRADLHAEGPQNAVMNGEITASGIRAAGVVIDEVKLPLRIANNHGVIDALRVIRGGNEVTIRAQADLPPDLREWQKIAWKAQGQATLRDVSQALENGIPARGTMIVTADAEGTGQTTRTLKGRVESTDVGFEDYQLPQVALEFGLNGQEATLDIPALRLGGSNMLSVKASMRMVEVMPVTLDWKLVVDDPTAFVTTVGLPALGRPASGRAVATGRASFDAVDPLRRLNGVVDVSLQNGQIGEAALPAVELHASAAGSEVTLGAAEIVFDDQNRISVKGSSKLAAPWSFAVDAALGLHDLRRLNPLLAEWGQAMLHSGKVDARIDLSGDAQPWRAEGSAKVTAAELRVGSMPESVNLDLETTFACKKAEIGQLNLALGPWTLRANGTVTDRLADLNELTLLQGDQALLAGHARVPFDLMQTGVAAGQPVDVALVATELPLDQIAKAAGLKDLPTAVVTVDLKARGRLDSLDAALDVGLRDVTSPLVPASLKPASVDVAMTFQSDRLKIDAQVLQPPLKKLTLKADVPVKLAEVARKPELAMNLPLKATLDLPKSDLSFVREFASEIVRSVPGTVSIHTTVEGTVKSPRLQSSIDLHVPEVTFVQPDMPSVRDVHVHIRGDNQRVTLDDVSVMLAGGRVKAGGEVDVAPLNNPKLELTLRAQEALIFRNPTSSLRANADLACSGRLQTAHVSGSVEAVRGRIFQEIDLLPDLVDIIPQGEKLPPVPPATSRVESQIELPPLMKDWTFDVKVRTRDPVVISGNLINGAISADIALGGTGADPQVTGFANVDRMLVKLPFSLMKITRGVAWMDPENPLTPKLDVRGESRVGMYDITMYAYGNAPMPKTRFTSSPPLSEADIVTLLSTGMTFSGDSSQVASEAATRALFLVISEAYRKLFNKKKTIRAEPPKLRLSYNPGAGDRTSDNVEATYDVTPNVRFTGRFMQGGRVKALLGYVLRFGKAARAKDDPSGPEAVR